MSSTDEALDHASRDAGLERRFLTAHSPLPVMAYENKPPQLQQIKALPEKRDLTQRCRTARRDIE